MKSLKTKVDSVILNEKLVKDEYQYITINNARTNYIVFKDGIIANIKKSQIMQHYLSKNGYEIVRLSGKKYKRKEFFVHKLLAIAFIPNPNSYTEIHHIDKNKRNNCLNNLIWISSEDHMKLHMNDNNHALAKGECHTRHILTENQVHLICKLLEQNKLNIKQIAEKLKIKRYLVSEIKAGNNWTHISKMYNIQNHFIHGIDAIPPKKVYKICTELENATLNISEIAKKYDTTNPVVLSILKFDTFRNISNNFDFSRSYKYSRKLKHSFDKEKILGYIDNDLSDEDILKIIGQPMNKTTTSILAQYRNEKH